MTQTKIVATLGPVSESPAVIRALIEAGADIFRINFSHGSAEAHRRMAKTVRAVAAEMGREVALLGDIAGPRIRCGDIAPEPTPLETGSVVILTPDDFIGSSALIPISYERLHEDVKVGDTIACDDGRIRLTVEAVEERKVICRVVEGGLLASRKGVNLPDSALQIGAITPADERSIALAASEHFDFLGLSFVGSAADVLLARDLVRQCGGQMALIAKIERRRAVEHLNEIVEASDGVMVARGDLGVELPIEQVPLVQKQILRACNEHAKPAITATQMLESMIQNQRPTRAEVTDIANAILDGTDAVMLSGETAVGRYPVEAVRAMDRVARAADQALDRRRWLHPESPMRDNDSAVAHAAVELAHHLKLDAIVCLTEGGSTPRRIARHRPTCPILAGSANVGTLRRLMLCWGVEPVDLPELAGKTSAVQSGNMELWVGHMARLCLRAAGITGPRRVVVVAGLPLGEPGITNFVHVAVIGEESP
ncbi:MAG: pyruvate kinase [Candidatus Sumerlaeia bacterium]|nr:pyruvate kinase [Candidatus Sumerlaeia bacterium]